MLLSCIPGKDTPIGFSLPTLFRTHCVSSSDIGDHVEFLQDWKNAVRRLRSKGHWPEISTAKGPSWTPNPFSPSADMMSTSSSTRLPSWCLGGWRKLLPTGGSPGSTADTAGPPCLPALSCPLCTFPPTNTLAWLCHHVSGMTPAPKVAREMQRSRTWKGPTGVLSYAEESISCLSEIQRDWSLLLFFPSSLFPPILATLSFKRRKLGYWEQQKQQHKNPKSAPKHSQGRRPPKHNPRVWTSPARC